MKIAKLTSSFTMLLVLTACVTINIYFPAAEAREAAEKIVDDILGDEVQNSMPGKDGQSLQWSPSAQQVSFSLLDLLIPSAHAAAKPDFSVNTPEVRRLQASMKRRNSSLHPYYQKGVIGFTHDALVGIRQLSAVSLKQRAQLKNLVKAENGDRNRLYKEIARANGHPDWEQDVRSVFGQTWIRKASKGWWYKNAGGSWVEK
ncbi:MAG: YdbL family protein [Chromatiales bacterium]|nr:YdbL family protein [Gammaproteobacteria bacterium]